MNKLLKQDQFKCFESLFLSSVVGINRTHFDLQSMQFAFVLSSSCVPVALRNPVEPFRRLVCTCSCTGATCRNRCWETSAHGKSNTLKAELGRVVCVSAACPLLVWAKTIFNLLFNKSSLWKVFLLQKFTVFREVKNSSFVKQGACGFTKCK